MKPILFNTDMVRAILDGRKTVTRRVMKPQPVYDGLFWKVYGAAWSGNQSVTPMPGHSLYNHAPYHPGDILYVRETWLQIPPEVDGGTGCFMYRADYREERLNLVNGIYVWHPSIHMPKIAARLFLRVKSIRAERLRDIDEIGATKEGCTAGVNDIAGGPWGLEDDPDAWTARESFAELWDITIKPSERNKYGWAANPWVWVIEFERCEKPQEVSHA